MPFVDWKEAAPFKKNGLPVDTEQFWIGLFQYKPFKEPATFSPYLPIKPCQQCCSWEGIFSCILR